MSPLACDVRNRFEEVYASELVRLRRRTAALPAADREAVEALAAQVMQAFSASIGAMIDGQLEEDVERMVRRIFGLGPPDRTASSSVPDVQRAGGRLQKRPRAHQRIAASTP